VIDIAFSLNSDFLVVYERTISTNRLGIWLWSSTHCTDSKPGRNEATVAISI